MRLSACAAPAAPISNARCWPSATCAASAKRPRSSRVSNGMKPLAVSMGDPAGIGLELAARVWADKRDAPPFFLVGDADAFLRAAKRVGAPSALVTLPIAKAVLHTADFGFPGHTEFIAHLTKDDPYAGVRGPVMML